MTPGSRHFRWHYGELDDKNFQLHGKSLLLLLLLLLSSFLLFFLLCFYFRRPFRLRPAAGDSSGGGAASSAGGMEPAAVKSLPVRVRREEAAACSICLSMVVVGDKERVLPGCDHGFHPECVDQWLKKRSSCPLCRAKVVREDAPLPEAAVVVVAPEG